MSPPNDPEYARHPTIRPKDAAALLLIDQSGNKPKVLVGRRHASLVFMPGMFVFPGGRVDKSDHLTRLATPLPTALQADLMKGTQKTSPSRARALAVAAVREAYEETGLCIGRAAATAAKLDGSWKPFADHGLLPDPSPLHLIARAITPPGQVRRFDTRFFAADATTIALRIPDIVHADAELIELLWIELGSAPLTAMHAITQAVLHQLAQHLATGPLRHGVPIPLFHYHRRVMRIDLMTSLS